MRYVILLSILASMLIINNLVMVNNEGNQRLEAIRSEFNSITKLPDATQYNYNEYVKSESIMIISKYTTSLRYNEIKDYYNHELKKNGWIFFKEENIYEWSQDYGGKLIRYRKDEYVLSIEHLRDKDNKFGLSISWGYKY